MEYISNLLPAMFEGTVNTLMIFFLTLLAAFPLGIIMSLARLSKFKPLNIFMQFYIWVFRGTPLLLQLFFIFYGLSAIGIVFDRVPAALIAFILNYAAYLAEICRAGIQSIDRGQYEAADVLGLNRYQTTMQIILPQMIKRILPPISNEVINLIKDTALIYTIGISELLRVARTAAVRDFNFVAFLVAAVFYLFMTAIIQQFFKWLESRYDYYR